MNTIEIKPKRCTLATIKSFVKKNQGNIYIRCISTFDGMVDGVRECKDRDTFSLALSTNDIDLNSYNLGIQGAWFVKDSRDYFSVLNKDGYIGYHVYNCCGSFDIAIKAPATKQTEV